ncbi:hypothetical protein ACIOEZ_34300 [Streptomyces sp. NPDC087866]|uniref:hypothetical protein n=1 Tax=Streptomyces sp. NPDC087866 TaxID=3365815 RepID=UPI0038053B22
MTTKTAEKPAPPAAAVAADAHWAATRERLANRTRPTAKLTICDDADIKKDLEVARYALRRLEDQAKETPDDKTVQAAVDSARADLEAAQAAFEEAAIVLTFRALPRKEFEALKKAHPATEEQAEDDLEFDVDSLGPELVSASSLDGITVEDAHEYLDTWGEAEAAELFGTAWGVQQQTRMDLGKG